MKKSKILGIGLGCAALTAVAIATPVIATSCSSEETKTDANAISAIVQGIGTVSTVDEFNSEGNATTTTPIADADAYKVSTNNNEISIFSGVKSAKAETVQELVSVKLADDAKKVLTEEVLNANEFKTKKADGETAEPAAITLTWAVDGNLPTGWHKIEANGKLTGIRNSADAKLTADKSQDVNLKLTLSQVQGDKTITKNITITAKFFGGAKK